LPSQSGAVDRVHLDLRRTVTVVDRDKFSHNRLIVRSLYQADYIAQGLLVRSFNSTKDFVFVIVLYDVNYVLFSMQDLMPANLPMKQQEVSVAF